MSIQGYDKAGSKPNLVTGLEAPAIADQRKQKTLFYYFLDLEEKPHNTPLWREKWLELPNFNFNAKNHISILCGLARAWNRQKTYNFGDNFSVWMKEHLYLWEDAFQSKNLTTLHPQGFSDVLYAFSLLDVHPHPQTLAHLEHAILRSIPQQSAKDISNFLGSIADARWIPSAPILHAAEKHILRIADSLTGFDVSKILTAYAGFGFLPGSKVLNALDIRARETAKGQFQLVAASFVGSAAVLDSLSKGQPSLSKTTIAKVAANLFPIPEKLDITLQRRLKNAAIWFGQKPTDLAPIERRPDKSSQWYTVLDNAFAVHPPLGLERTDPDLPLLDRKTSFAFKDKNGLIVHLETDQHRFFNQSFGRAYQYTGFSQLDMHLTQKVYDRPCIRFPYRTYLHMSKSLHPEEKFPLIAAFIKEAADLGKGTHIIRSTSKTSFGLQPF